MQTRMQSLFMFSPHQVPPIGRTYPKIGMEHGAVVALAEQGVQAGGIAALWPRLQNAALPDAPPHSIGTEQVSCLAALSAQGNTFQVFHLCARLARRENRFCHAYANFEIGSSLRSAGQFCIFRQFRAPLRPAGGAVF